MATAITYADVTNGFTTSVPEAQVNLLIGIVDDADTCLDNNSVSAGAQEMLKVTAVRHMLTLMSSADSGKGSVTSEQAPSGAGRSFAAPDFSKGLLATSYGALLKQLDKFGCVVNVIENQARLSIRSVGREYPNNK